MKFFRYVLFLLSNLPLGLCAQSNVGIGGSATRARLEVFSGTNPAVMSALFGGEGNGISFQQNWPGVGFNQYRTLPTGYGKYMATGYGAVQYMNPGDGTIALDMQSVSGFSNNDLTEPYRAFSIFSNGTVSFGKGLNNSNLVVDYLNRGSGNLANGSVIFYGTQHQSSINASTTYFTPGKDGGTTYINDIPSGHTVIGTANAQHGLAINTSALYLTSLSIRHATAGGGLALIEQTSFNNWEWYLSNDNPCWMGQKYNGLLIGDYNPTTGQHGYVSDRRLKSAIRPMPAVMDKLMKLQAVQYRMLGQEEDAKPEPGFIAQEVRKLFPDMVTVLPGNGAGDKAFTDLHMLNYSQFFVLAIKAIQEQQAEISALTRQLEALEQSINKVRL